MNRYLIGLSTLLSVTLLTTGCNPSTDSSDENDGASVVQDSELNNSLETAQVIPETVEKITGSVGGSNDQVDIYKVTYTGTDIPRIYAYLTPSFASTSGTMTIELADKYNYYINDVSAADGEEEWISNLTMPSTYYLYVYASEQGSYEIVFEAELMAENTIDSLATGLTVFNEDANVINDDADDAMVVTPPVRINGSLGTYSDNGMDEVYVDWGDCYEFEVAADDSTYTFKLDAAGTNDFDLYLLDELNQDLDSSETTDSEESLTKNLDAGFYHACVYDYAGTGTYGLDITFE